MAVVVAIVLVAVLALAYLPQLWVRRVIQRYSVERPDYSGTGGQFARYLLDGMGLGHVIVEESRIGDHYDPEAKAVRLGRDNMHGKSLTAIVIAAHEVGHAMQDATGYRPLQRRTSLARQAARYETVGSMVMLAAPIVLVLAKSPLVMGLAVAAGLMILAMTVLMHAMTLPVEFDASFNRALPLLREGRYISEEELPAARSILRAAALTYVAAAALSLLDVMRWLRVLRF
ncbi:MAG: hypothetical protein RLZ98_291 [Pseudomonadota bacterium]|jgi:Zn-dependent membrane protease YugP